MRTQFGFFLFLLFSGNFFNAFSQAGTIDSSFNFSGIGEFAFQGYTDANTVVIQKDNKIVIGGLGDLNSSDGFVIVRYNTNGAIDKSFGNSGKVYQHIGAGVNEGGYIALQEDGKILVSGDCRDPDTHTVVYSLTRFNTDGTIDKSFNGTGTVFTYFNDDGNIFMGYKIAVQKNQQIIQIGQVVNLISQGHATTKIGIVRYNTDGTLDNTFGTGGKVTLDFGARSCGPGDIAIQQDGKIIVCGGTAGWNSNNDNEGFPIIARFNSDGTLDNSFGIGGKVITCFLPGCVSNGTQIEDGGALGIAIQRDGKLIIANNVWISTDTNSFIRFIRYNADGSIDSGFGNKGKVETIESKWAFSQINSICLQTDEKIILAGDFGYYNPRDFVLIRYNKDGSLDSSFGVNGYVITKIDNTDDNSFSSVTFQSDGRIVAAGWSDHHGMVVLRFLSGLNLGLLDFRNENCPFLIYPNPIHSEAMLQYKLTKDEKLSIVLYDMLGRQVQTFISNETRMQGEHKDVLQFSSALTAGNYILSISNGKCKQNIKIMKQ